MCPEQMGGLPTPRNPSERRGDRVVMRTGEDVTEQYRRGAACALRLYQLLGCKAAVLKERSLLAAAEPFMTAHLAAPSPTGTA